MKLSNFSTVTRWSLSTTVAWRLQACLPDAIAEVLVVSSRQSNGEKVPYMSYRSLTFRTDEIRKEWAVNTGNALATPGYHKWYTDREIQKLGVVS